MRKGNITYYMSPTDINTTELLILQKVWDSIKMDVNE